MGQSKLLKAFSDTKKSAIKNNNKKELDIKTNQSINNKKLNLSPLLTNLFSRDCQYIKQENIVDDGCNGCDEKEKQSC